MRRSLRQIVLSLFIMLAWGPGWLMLWTISFYLTRNGQQAALLLPHGVQLALLILLARRYWPALFIPQTALSLWLWHEQLIIGGTMAFAPFITAIPALLVQRFWHRFPLYWQRLSLLLSAVAGAALLNTLLLTPFIESRATLILLASFTGGVLLTPFVYLIFDYLRQQHRYQLLGLETRHPPLRTSLLLWCSLFFITTARQVGSGFSDLMELEIFLSTQALLGIGLGIAISRQEQLASNLDHYRQRLEVELDARRALTEKLIHAEEDTRKQLARELHDEIGQNITAIQIQSQLVKRASDNRTALMAGEQISELAQRIHHSTRQLLRQLRPPVLDQMALDEALHHLVREFAFPERGIRCQFHYQLTAPPDNETVVFTLYRLLQELLNNVAKHANATEVDITLSESPGFVHLRVSDNGVGVLPDHAPGMGMQGMSERVQALGGELLLESQPGVRVTVNLPTLLPQNIL